MGRRKGYKHTIEEKLKIRESTKKAMARPEVKEKVLKANRRKRKYVIWNRGLTKETDLRLRKISKDLKGHDFKNHKKDCQCCVCKGKRGELEGKNHHLYGRKGIQANGWNKTFKEQIRYRDGYKCQICGCPEVECERKLSVHHIDYNKDNLNPNNLISLCHSCHQKTNGNRDYWKRYFKNLMKSKMTRVVKTVV